MALSEDAEELGGTHEAPCREHEVELFEKLQTRYVQLFDAIKTEQFGWRAASAHEERPRRSASGLRRARQPWTPDEALALRDAAFTLGLSRPASLKSAIEPSESPPYKHESGDVIDALIRLTSLLSPFADDPNTYQWVSCKLDSLRSAAGDSPGACALAGDRSCHPLLSVEPLLRSIQPRAWLRRVRLLDQLEHLLSDASINVLDRETQAALMHIRDFSLPPWWSPKCDLALLCGVHKHGFGNYSCIRSDSELITDFTGEQQWADQDTNTSWPADEVLNARIERIVDAFRQAQQRKEDLHARDEEKRKREEERSQGWTKKDRQEFVRALMQFGVPRTKIGGTEPDWETLKRVANLPRKWETTLESAYHDLVDEMKRLNKIGGPTSSHKEDCRCVACQSKRKATGKKQSKTQGKKKEPMLGDESMGEEDDDAHDDADGDDSKADGDRGQENGNDEMEGDYVGAEGSGAPEEEQQQEHQQYQKEQGPQILTAKTASWLKDRLNALDTLHWAYRSFKGNWAKRLGLLVHKREELPSWWAPNKHDKELVYGTLRYGYCNWQAMRTDDSLTFLKGGAEAAESTEHEDDDPSQLDPVPHAKVLSKRVRHLVSFFKRFGAKHGKRRRDASDLPSRSTPTANRQKKRSHSEGEDRPTIGPRSMPPYKAHTDEAFIKQQKAAQSETAEAGQSQAHWSGSKRRRVDSDPALESQSAKALQSVSFDENGKPTLPVKLTAKMTLESLGTIDATRQSFHSDRRVFPIGYSIRREYTSMNDPNEGNTTYQLIVTERDNQPLFRIVCDACPEYVIERNSATGAWGEVANIIAEKKGMPRGKTTASGIDMFGLSHPTVEELLKRQPEYDKLIKLHSRPPEFSNQMAASESAPEAHVGSPQYPQHYVHPCFMTPANQEQQEQQEQQQQMPMDRAAMAYVWSDPQLMAQVQVPPQFAQNEQLEHTHPGLPAIHQPQTASSQAAARLQRQHPHPMHFMSSGETQARSASVVNGQNGERDACDSIYKKDDNVKSEEENKDF